VALPSSVLVIINPVSGPKRRGTASERVATAERTFARLGVAGQIGLTEGPLHAHELAQNAAQGGIDLVVAWGGDGTINEIGRALAYSPTAIGIIPGGSGNGLSRELNIPFDPGSALERALTSKERVIDAGEIDGRIFFNIAGAGLDAHVARKVAMRVHHRGFIPYLFATSRDVLAFEPSEYSIETDSGSIDTSALFIAIANSPQYGFGARIAPHARHDDGVLNLIVVEDRGLVGNLVRVPSLFVGSIDARRGVRASTIHYARIRASTPMLLHVDGEPLEARAEAVVRVHPGALRIRA